jgi:type II secretory pathway pseudopilin PulG
MSSTSGQRAGGTLLELLVAVAIIFLLASMLIPAALMALKAAHALKG